MTGKPSPHSTLERLQASRRATQKAADKAQLNEALLKELVQSNRDIARATQQLCRKTWFEHFRNSWLWLCAEISTVIVIFATAYVMWVDLGDRKQQRVTNAWQLITAKAPGNSGKIKALEYLNSEKISWLTRLVRINQDAMCQRALSYQPATERQCEPSDYIIEVLDKQSIPLRGVDLSDGKGKAPPYLRGVRLMGADLRDADLQGADFRNADFRGADLRDTDLSHADLQGADLRDADLRDADLSGANLEHTDLSAANLSSARLSGSQLREAKLSGANLEGADLSNADLWRADLSGGQMWQANFSAADLRRANLSGANLWGADLSSTFLWRTNLSGADLSMASLGGANLRDANLSLAVLPSEIPAWTGAPLALTLFPDGSQYPTGTFSLHPLSPEPHELYQSVMPWHQAYVERKALDTTQ